MHLGNLKKGAIKRFLILIIVFIAFMNLGFSNSHYKSEAVQFDKTYAQEFDKIYKTYKTDFLLGFGEVVQGKMTHDELNQLENKFVLDAKELNKNISNARSSEGIKKLREILSEKIKTQIALEQYYPPRNVYDDEEFDKSLLDDFFMQRRAYELDVIYRTELERLTTGKKYATINIEAMRNVKLGDGYEDVIEKFHMIGEPLTRKITPAETDNYFTRHLFVSKNLIEEYQWRDDNAKVIAMFKNNALVEIKQNNLK